MKYRLKIFKSIGEAQNAGHKRFSFAGDGTFYIPKGEYNWKDFKMMPTIHGDMIGHEAGETVINY